MGKNIVSSPLIVAHMVSIREQRKEENLNIIEKRKEINNFLTIIPREDIKSRDIEEFKLTEEEKEICQKKTLDELVDEIGGSILTCPPGKEHKKAIGKRELTADLVCFRKRIRKKSPKQIREAYDKLLKSDPERLCE